MAGILRSVLIISLFVLQFATTAVGHVVGQVAGINSITSHLVTKAIDNIDQDTLVLIDIDYTVVIPSAKIFSSSYSPYFSLIDNLINYNRKQRNYYNAALQSWYLNRKLQLIEYNWPDFIEKLKASGATVIGLPNMDISWYDLIKEPELVRYKELKELGINFTKKIMDKELFLIDIANGRQSIFYYGIIFNGPHTKIEALINFLKVSSLMPKRIIYFDHDESNVRSLKKLLSSSGVEYTGFIYNGFKNFDTTMPDLNIINYQQNLLTQQGKWVEDDEAQRLIDLNVQTTPQN